MYIIFRQRGERQLFVDFCEEILWALKPTLIKDLMTKGAGYVRQTYPHYLEDARLFSNLDALKPGKRRGEWLLNGEAIDNFIIQQIMDDQAQSMKNLVCDDYVEPEFLSPIKVYSCDEDELCLELDTLEIPLSWLSILSKSFNLMIVTIGIDYRKKNPYKDIACCRIRPMPADQVKLVYWKELRCGRLVTIRESTRSDTYSVGVDLEYIFLSNPFFEIPDMVYSLETELSNLKDGIDTPSPMHVYNPMLEFLQSGGRSRAPEEVDELIGQQFYRGLFDAFSDVTESMPQGPELKYIKKEVQLYKERGWNEYIVYLSELMPQVSNSCFSFKGSVTESLLLEKVTRNAGATYLETQWYGQYFCEHDIEGELFHSPLFMDCNVVCSGPLLSERKRTITEAIVSKAKELWLNAYSIDDGRTFIISKQRIPASKVQEVGDAWRDYDPSCKYLRINLNCDEAL